MDPITILVIVVVGVLVVLAMTPTGKKALKGVVNLFGSRAQQGVDAATTADDRLVQLRATAQAQAQKTMSALLSAGTNAQQVLDGKKALEAELIKWQRVLDECTNASLRLKADGIDDLEQAKEFGTLASNGERAMVQIESIEAQLKDNAEMYAQSEAAVAQMESLAGQVDSQTSSMIRRGEFMAAQTRLAAAQSEISESGIQFLNANTAAEALGDMNAAMQKAKARATAAGRLAAVTPTNAEAALAQVRAAAGTRTARFEEHLRAAADSSK